MEFYDIVIVGGPRGADPKGDIIKKYFKLGGIRAACPHALS